MVSALDMCRLRFVYNSTRVSKCYKVNLITYSTGVWEKWVKHIFAHPNFFISYS